MSAAKRFGQNLKRIREAMGMTQVEFARKARISQGTLSKYERGISSVRLSKLVKILAVTGKSFEEMVS